MKTTQSLIVTVALLIAGLPARANPFADIFQTGWYQPGPGQFVNDPQFNDPTTALGAPLGGYVNNPNNDSQVTLGDGGWIKLGFSSPIHDNPKNPYGLDFIVFSNAQYTGLNPYLRWQELAFVEISQDGALWFLIEPSIRPANLVGGVDTGQSSTVVSGYAEYTPTLMLPEGIRTPEECYTVPDRQSVPGNANLIATDGVSGGGDGFDIAKAVRETSRGVPMLNGNGNTIPAGISWFSYVRISDAVAGDVIPGLGEISAEIDAVAEARPALTIGETKRLEPNGFAVISDAVVTARFESDIFIEAADRSAAMRIVSTADANVGDKITVTGHLSATDGRHSFLDPMFTRTSTANALPGALGMPIRSLVSSAAYGLRARTWGKVTSVGDHYCVVKDGDLTAKLIWTDSAYQSPAVGSSVAATGICDREEGSATTTLRLTDPANDIRTYH